MERTQGKLVLLLSTHLDGTLTTMPQAQFMAQEYKKQGGTYTTDKESGQDESQKNLSKWSEEEWQTKEGSGTAKEDDGTRHRYLPKKAWEQMNDKEKEETDEKKQDASAEGQQFVGNTGKAKGARKNANEEEAQQFENKKAKQNKGKKTGNQTNGDAPRRSARGAKKEEETAKKDDADDDEWEDPPIDDDVAQEHPDSKEEDQGESKSKPEQANTGQKRGRGAKKGGDDSSKKQKANDGSGKQNGSFGSKHDNPEAPAPAASVDRLPKKGQRISWKALPGWVHGETVEIVTTNKEVDGKSIKASKQDPRIVVKSDKGKIAIHKPGSCHFDG